MIRRLAEADATKVRIFLKRTFEDDPEAGGNTDSVWSTDHLKQVAQEDGPTILWVCIEGGQTVGILSYRGQGKRELDNGKRVTFNAFDLLAVDYSLYQVNRREAIRIARELTLFAADDLTASGEAADYIYVFGPTDSRGSSWCRLLGMKEEAMGNQSHFLLEFKLIWERTKATENL